MKVGGATDEFSLLGELAAAGCDHLLRQGERLDASVDDFLVKQRPRVFGRLDFRAVGWLEEEIDSRWGTHLGAGMLACAAEHQQEKLVRSSPLFVCKRLEHQRATRKRWINGQAPWGTKRFEHREKRLRG